MANVQEKSGKKLDKRPKRQIHPNSLANLLKEVPRKGRPKGELNKVNRNLKTAITEFVDGRSDKLDALIDEIHAVNGAAAAWDRIVGLFEYRLPKLARVEHTGSEGGPISVVQVSFTGISQPKIAQADVVQSQLGTLSPAPVETTTEEYANPTDSSKGEER
jgi:pyocin large subunit-like protein